MVGGPDSPERPPARGPGLGTKIVRGLGELLVTAGVIVLLFVVYEVYVTDWMSASKQQDANQALDDKWRNERTLHADPLDGESFARMYIPSFGADYKFAIQEGTGAQSLDVGPGHYTETAMPGHPGNFAVAGHRVGKGAPFNDIDLLNSCDAIVVETGDSFFIYRVLPKKDEVAGWAHGAGKRPQCAKVEPMLAPDEPDGGLYGKTFGQEIVLPNQGEVINPIPNQPENAAPIAQRASLMTLTTCHPRFSDRERLIVHAVMVKQYPKDPKNPGQLPPEMEEQA
ncbi:MAG: class E sortase [Pseudonocardiaceae bacterium]|nr:class E sortase [Pseudonocardiaceae bacterium]